LCQGFEACCDGHAELEVHLPCDTSVDPWRIVVSGESDCMRCTPLDVGNTDTSTCSANTGSAGCCGDVGGDSAQGCGLDQSRCASGDPYLGCFVDDPTRDLDGEQYTIEPSRATLETCSQYCYSRGYTFYAMQMGTTCFCDDDYVK